MRGLFFLCSFVFLNHSLYAHEANEAFFVVKKKGNSVVVEAELPWTMRDALVEFNPALKNAVDKQDFENTFVRYLKKNLILIDGDGHQLPFLEFREIDKIGHSHQNNFVLTYKGTSVVEITNTVMFNIYDNQVNYITVQLFKEQNTYETKKGESTVEVYKKGKGTRIDYLALILLFVVGIGVLFLRKKITIANKGS